MQVNYAVLVFGATVKPVESKPKLGGRFAELVNTSKSFGNKARDRLEYFRHLRA